MEEDNSYKQTDDLIRSRFDGAESVPSAKSWDDIEKRLDDKGKKRPPFIYWLSGIALLLIVAGCILYFKQNADLERSMAAIDKNAGKMVMPAAVNETKIETSRPVATNAATAQPITTSENSTQQASQTDNANDASIGSTTVTTSETPSPKPTQEKTTKEETTFLAAASVKEQESSTSGSRPASEKHKLKSNNLSKNNSTVVSSEKEKGNANKAPEVVASVNSTNTAGVAKPTSNTSIATPENKGASSSASTMVNASPKKDSVVATAEVKKQKENPSALIASSEQEKVDSLAKTVSKNEKPDTASIQKDSVKTAVAAASLTPKKDSLKPDANEQTLPMALSVYFSPDYFQNKVVDNSGQFAADEKQSLRYSAGFKFSYVLLDKLSVRLGVAYSEFKQQLDDHKIYFDRYITEPFVFHSSLGDMAVDPDVMRDGYSAMAPATITQFWTNYNYTQSIQSIHIPLEVKYGFNFKKIGISVIAGATTQYAFRQHSELTLTKENTVNNLSYTNMNINKLTFSGSLGLSLDLNLNKRWSIFLEPNARMNFTSVSKSTVVKSNPHFFGANAGLAIHF